MPDFLTLAAAAHPQRAALLDGEQVIDYAQLNARVARLCARLTALGLRRGETAAVLLNRSAAAVTLVHALARLGVRLVPLNLRLTAEEMRWQIEQSQSQWALSVIQPPPLPEAIPLEALPARSAAAGWQRGSIETQALFGILFTSGTTGQPKGALLTWDNLFWNATASAFRLGALPSDRWLLTLPLYHIGGLSILFRSALYGSAVVLPNFPADRFDLPTLWQRMHATRTTLVSLVPTMLYRLLQAHPQGAAWPDALRLILLGGAAAPEATLKAALQARLPLAVTYGLSETASQVATAEPGTTRRKPGTAGRPLMWTELRIVDEAGQTLPASAHGEILVRGRSLMRGYLGKSPALRDGWLHTGDLGYLDDEGDLWVLQRRQDLILSGGENVYPAEVEAALLRHPAIAEACVVGLPHPEWGQQVAAAITVRRGAQVTPAVIEDFLRQRLAGYKMPRKLLILPSLPQTASGKIMRREVARLLADSPTTSTEPTL